MKKIYIAYGSNMDLDQMEWRCPGARLLAKGELKDWRLMFKGSLTGSYATIEREKGQTVPVLLWEVTPADEAALDIYEGFPRFYYKKTILVQNVEYFGKGKTKGSCLNGMVYIMHEERKLGHPTAGYYDLLADAYDEFGFDRDILEEALLYSKP